MSFLNRCCGLRSINKTRPSCTLFSALFAVGFVCCFVESASAQQTRYSLGTIGLTDDEHTRLSVFVYSEIDENYLRETGGILGRSDRYSSTGTNLGSTAWWFDGSQTLRVGLVDQAHTKDDGFRRSRAAVAVSSGYVAGTSNRFDGNVYRGNSAWHFDGNQSSRVGLWDSEHTNADGFQNSLVDEINRDGWVAGRAIRFDDSSTATLAVFGHSAWVSNGSTTTRVGFVDATHRRNDGYQNSEVTHLSDSGLAIGYSASYDTAGQQGSTAWMYDLNTQAYTQLGLTGSDYVSSTGRSSSIAQFVRQNGALVAGGSLRYRGGASNNASTWIRENGVTRQIGLSGGVYQSLDETEFSRLSGLTESGIAFGQSRVYDGDRVIGNDAWLDQRGSSRRVGLYGVGYQQTDGSRQVSIDRVTQQNMAIGTASRYNGNQYQGLAAWAEDLNGVQNGAFRIGLVDQEHTSSSGVQVSVGISEQAVTHTVVGQSDRYDGDRQIGRSAFFVDGQSTRRIGLVSEDYVRDDGFMMSRIMADNALNQVAGHSQRFQDGSFVGEVGFIYDSLSDTTFELNLSESSSGQVQSTVEYLSDDGVAVGRYTFYSPGFAQYRAFHFSVETGMVDLGLLIEGNLEDTDWQHLERAFSVDTNGNIVGHGVFSAHQNSSMGFVLSPIASVPEPGTLCLMSILGVLLAARRRRVA